MSSRPSVDSVDDRYVQYDTAQTNKKKSATAPRKGKRFMTLRSALERLSNAWTRFGWRVWGWDGCAPPHHTLPREGKANLPRQYPLFTIAGDSCRAQLPVCVIVHGSTP